MPLLYYVKFMDFFHHHFSSMFRYGNQVTADELNALYGDSRAKGFGHEVHNDNIIGSHS